MGPNVPMTSLSVPMTRLSGNGVLGASPGHTGPIVETAAEGRPMVVTAESAPAEHPPSIDVGSLPRISKQELRNMFEIQGGKFIHDAIDFARHPGYIDLGMGLKYQLPVEDVLDAVKDTQVSLADASGARMTDPKLCVK